MKKLIFLFILVFIINVFVVAQNYEHIKEYGKPDRVYILYCPKNHTLNEQDVQELIDNKKRGKVLMLFVGKQLSIIELSKNKDDYIPLGVMEWLMETENIICIFNGDNENPSILFEKKVNN